MYVDESGVESVYDKTKFFVTAGAIFHEDDLENMKTSLRDYKKQHFTSSYADAEIHVYNMYKGRAKFFGLNRQAKLNLLTPLYDVINNLPFTAIVIGIDKQKFIQRHSDPSKILDYGYMLLVERFDKFIEEKSNNGIMRIDRTTCMDQAELNLKDTTILKLINKIRKRGTKYQSAAVRIIEEPHFLPSHTRLGLQVVDAVVYCANRHINKNMDFDPYWNIVYSKLRRNSTGVVDGYGFRIYPK